MEIIDFQHEVLNISVAIGLSFYDFDTVIDALNFSRGYGEVKVIEDADSMPAQLFGESSQRGHSGTQSFLDPVVEQHLSCASGWQSPESTQIFLKHIGDRDRPVYAKQLLKLKPGSER